MNIVRGFRRDEYAVLLPEIVDEEAAILPQKYGSMESFGGSN